MIKGKRILFNRECRKEREGKAGERSGREGRVSGVKAYSCSQESKFTLTPLISRMNSLQKGL